jgi:hypothetical protein
MNSGEFPGGSGVEATILSHEVIHHEAFPCPRIKTPIERGVGFRCALQPICWKDRIIVLIFSPFSVGGEQIDRADVIFMTLGEIKFIVVIIVRFTPEKRTKSYGFVVRVHLLWFLGNFEVQTWFFLSVPVAVWQSDASRTL